METIAVTGNHGGNIRSDCRVTLERRKTGGLEVLLQSRVQSMYGRQIREQAAGVLTKLGISHARIHIEDTGALPFVLSARIEAAARMLDQDVPAVVPDMLQGNARETKPGRTRFSRLYLPGNTPGLMLNAGIHEPDGIILDLEDSVAPEKKQEARILVRNALCQLDFCGAERMVRINQLPMGLEDLEHVVPYHVNLILLPKCESPEQVREVDRRMTSLLESAGHKGNVFLMPILESCLGIEHAFEIATSSNRVVAMAIGLEDYTADLGVQRSEEGRESLYARTRLVNACKAAGIQPIDSVYSDVDNMEGLARTVGESRALGFEGMGCIHPRQVPVIRKGFLPVEEEITRAEAIVAAWAEAREKGLGVVSLGSKMIDAPVVSRARQTMDLAYRFGLRQKDKQS